MSKIIKKIIKKDNLNSKKQKGKKLFIVTGATGNLGFEYCNYLYGKNNVENDLDKDGINDKIFASNVSTFENIFGIIQKKILNNTNFIAICFGSISDKFNVPYWSSYTHSKNILREILKNLNKINPNYKGFFANVSTVDTGNENELRPNPLEKENWLSVQEIVVNTIDEFDKKYSYLEIDLFRNSPNYTNDFFTSHSKILRRWLKQMKN